MAAPITKDSNKKIVPWIFGVYANMARHNVYRILADIADRCKTRKGISEDKLSAIDVLTILKNTDDADSERPDKCKRVIELLYKHFPFLRYLNKTLEAGDADPQVYYDVMQQLLDTLNNVRNQYSHAMHGEQAFSKEIIRWMVFSFDNGIPEIKKRFGLDEKALEYLRRYKGMDKETKKPKRNSDFEFEFTDNTSGINEMGLAFFICMF
ncbi:MAG: hypothetical protein ABI921_04935 [Panacibacter sp.]